MSWATEGGSIVPRVRRTLSSTTPAVQEALEGGQEEDQKKLAALEASLAQAQEGLKEAEAAKQTLQERLEEQQETLYNQVSCVQPSTPSRREASGGSCI